MRKKALSVLLALGMILSLLPGQALAEAETQAEAELLLEEADAEGEAELPENADAQPVAELSEDAEAAVEAELPENADAQPVAELSEDAEAIGEAELPENADAQPVAELSEDAEAIGEAELSENADAQPVAELSEDAEAELSDAGAPVSLRIVPPNAKTVELGAALDITGLEVYAVYADETEEAVTDYALSLPEPAEGESKLGERNAVVRYGDLTATFPVTVTEEDYIAGIAPIIKPKKRVYTQGEPLDITGMQVLVAYHLGRRDMIKGELCTVTGYNPNQLGVQTITVSYGGKSSEILVKVIPGQSLPMPANVPTLMAPRIQIESVQGGKKIRLTRDNNDDSSFYSQYPGEQTKIYYTLDGSAPTPGAAGTFEYDGGSIDAEETVTVKAVAILGAETSAVSSGRVSVPQVEAPIPANPNHWQGLNGGVTELASGTLVSFLCDTAGASIYYWFEGKMSSAEDSRYGSSVYVDDANANDNGEVVLYAYAAKDGYRNSDSIKLSYRVPKAKPPASELVNVFAGTVRGRAGAPMSASLSITTEESSYVTSFNIKIRYDKQNFRFESVSPVETGGANSKPVIAVGDLFIAPDPANGFVRVMYNGEAVSGGEMCMLNFRAMDSAEDDSYLLSVDPEAEVSTSSGRPVEEKIYDGSITLEGSHNSQLTMAVLFSGDDYQDVPNVDGLSNSDKVNASLTVDEESAQDYINSLPHDESGNPPLTVTANAFVAFYSDDGNMLSLETWEIDLSDLTRLLFERMMDMPDEAAEIKTMVLSESLTPIMAVEEL